MSAEKIDTLLRDLLHILPIILVILGCLSLATAIVFILVRFWEWRNILRADRSFLEVTPPASADKTPLEAQEFFNVLHGIGLSTSVQEAMQRKRFTASFEVSSTKNQGIRYIFGVPKESEVLVRQAIAAHINNARIKRIDDYLPTELNHTDSRVLEFKQAGRYYFPLKTYNSFLDHDSMAYLTTIMTELEKNDHLTFQIVASPAVVSDAKIIAQRVRRNENLLAGNHSVRLPKSVRIVVGLPMKLASEALHFIVDVIASSPQSQNRIDIGSLQSKGDLKPMRSITPHEQEVNEGIHTKTNQHLYRIEIRALVKATDSANLKRHIKALRGTLSAFNTQHQQLRARFNFPNEIKGRYRIYSFKNRLPSLFHRNSCILSTEELANLFHFPSADTNTESLVQSFSRTLPATLSLKRGNDIDIVLGVNRHQGHETPIGLSKASRALHVYTVGSTGSGKSTMMKYSIVQDIVNGKGVALLDPHGDLAREILQYVPEERINDVIYFDPDDLQFPIRLNMLELDPELKGDDLERQKYLLTEYTVEIFRKLFSDDDSGGSRIEAVLRNAIYTAFTTKDPTLFTIYRLITDKDYRKKVVAKLDDEVLKNFWNNEFDSGGEYQRVKMGFGITTKVGRFLTAVFVRRVMDSPKSTIDFDDIINSGKILICRLSKGDLVKDTSSLFGTTILARLQIAGQRRGKMREQDRKPFYIYIDEFQNFATTTFVDMLAEARKYGLHLFMAEQSTSQQDQDVIHNILGNAGTVVCFSTGNPMDEQLLLPRFQPAIGPGEIQNLPSWNFYIRIKQNGLTDSQMPVSGETLLLDEAFDKAKEDRVIEASRANYAMKYEPETRGEAAQDDENTNTGNVTNPTVEPV